MNSRERVARRAEALIGTNFRPQGRDNATGLDCIGLVAAALGISPVRSDYSLRGGTLENLKRALEAAGLEQTELPQRGDILVLAAGPGQLHLAIFTGKGIIHADAGLRRVAARPGPAPWPVLGTWRLKEES